MRFAKSLRQLGTVNRNLSEQANTYYESWKLELTGEPVELSSVIDVRDGTHASPKPQDEVPVGNIKAFV